MAIMGNEGIFHAKNGDNYFGIVALHTYFSEGNAID